jgi:hypothetical protein
MTLKEAKKISGLVTDIFAQKPKNGYLRESQLCGYSLFDIHHAYALVIALRRQLAAYEPNMKSEAYKYADLVAGLVVSVPAMVLPDQEVDRLTQIPNDTNEYKRIKMGIIVEQINRWNSNPVWGKQEAIDSFNKFCWLLDPKDTLYWQKVYTHLGLPYDSDSPKGMPDITFDDNARESWVVPQNAPQAKSNMVKVFLLIAGVIAVVWFLIKH